MKILVLSDSHSSLFFMRSCIRAIRPDAVVHLGDYFDDAAAVAEENPQMLFHQVPGNCDRYRVPAWQSQVLSYPIGGVNMYMTHGHNHRVKQTLSLLLADARASGAAAVLYGHTHCPDCHREEDGLWVLNPGSAGYGGGSAGLIEIFDEKISSCRILRQEDLEGYL